MTETTKYTRLKVRNRDKTFSGSPRAKSDRWQLIIERDVPNPDFIPKSKAPKDADGNDARTRSQKRSMVAEQKSTMYQGVPITEAKAKEAARNWLESENAKLEKPNEANVFVADYVDSYLDKHDVTASTMTGYLDAAKHIRKAFACITMADLTTNAVERWLSSLKEAGYSEQTQYRDYKVLHMVCRYAARRDINVIEYDPTENVRKRPSQSSTKEQAESNCLTLNAPEGQESTYDKHLRILSDMEPTPLVAAAYIATYAGLRIGEVCGLRWWDIDFHNGILHVRNAIGTKGRIKDNAGGSYLKSTKNESSKRDIPLNPVLTKKLHERERRMLAELKETGIKEAEKTLDGLFVVGSIDGSFANPTTLSKQWTAHAEAFGLRGKTGKVVTFHGLRHTFASRLVLVNKVDPKTAGDILGHSNAVMTYKVYASTNEQAKRDAINSV